MFHIAPISVPGQPQEAALSNKNTDPDAFFRRILEKHHAKTGARRRSTARILTSDLFKDEHMREERLWRKDAMARLLAADI